MADDNMSIEFSVKYEAAAPYHFFLTTVADEPKTFKQLYSVSFQELIDHTSGELTDCLHLSCVIEADWIVEQYEKAAQTPNITVIYSRCTDYNFCSSSDPQFDSEKKSDFNSDLTFNIEFEEAKWHYMLSKISILKYKDDKIRIIISSANLYSTDWTTRTQGLWVSPFLPLLPDDADYTKGESPTYFKKDFIEYLTEHQEPQVFGWLSLLYRTDFSAVKVFFLGSVPGKHEDSKYNAWGRNKLGKILSEHVVLPKNAKDWPIVARCSIEWIGPNYYDWLNCTLHKMSMEKDKRIIFRPEVKVIHPSENNYLQCYDHQHGSKQNFYSKRLHLSQEWIKNDMYQWKAEKINRTRASPRLNCYTRISPDNTEIPWFVFSSSNLSRFSWGECWDDFYLNQPKIRMTSYQAGVVFIPKFLVNQNTFPISDETSSKVPTFLLPFDVPLIPYEKYDEPYFGFETYEKPKKSENVTCREKARDETIARMQQNGLNVDLVQPGGFASKHASSAPYYYFLNKVNDSSITDNQDFIVSFPELLDISLGEIVDSLYMSCIVDVKWLCFQYLLAAQSANMTIFSNCILDAKSNLSDINIKNIIKNSDIKLKSIPIRIKFGCHGLNLSVFQYRDGGIRIVVFTGNIYKKDWENKIQALWMSPHLPRLPDSANPGDGESPTNFKKNFREYLAAYKQPELVEWWRVIQRADFSAVNVFFIASVPGRHEDSSLNAWGHRKLASILSEHAVLPPDARRWTLTAQCTNIGTLGPHLGSWLLPDIIESMSQEKTKDRKSNPNFQLIYPTLKIYEESSFYFDHDEHYLKYWKKNHEKQGWLKNYMCQWKPYNMGRKPTLPSCNTYTRISPDQTEIPWFVLTSANLTKSAWGRPGYKENSLVISNYEAGVVFIPKFVINKTSFPIKSSNSPEVPVFRLPYDLPLIRYELDDQPYVVD